MMVLRNLGGARYLLHLRGRRNCCRHHRPRFLRDGPAASAAPQLEARAREWGSRATSAARRALIALGVQRGDAVAIAGPNRPECMMADLGAQGTLQAP